LPVATVADGRFVAPDSKAHRMGVVLIACDSTKNACSHPSRHRRKPLSPHMPPTLIYATQDQRPAVLVPPCSTEPMDSLCLLTNNRKLPCRRLKGCTRSTMGPPLHRRCRIRDNLVVDEARDLNPLIPIRQILLPLPPPGPSRDTRPLAPTMLLTRKIGVARPLPTATKHAILLRPTAHHSRPLCRHRVIPLHLLQPQLQHPAAPLVRV
jgi:hypothetical protein